MKFLVLMLGIVASMQGLALTCEQPDYDCSLALSTCINRMDNRYCGGGKCSCREALAFKHPYLGLSSHAKVIEMYYLELGTSLKYYVYACDELPCECQQGQTEVDGKCQCDKTQNYVAGSHYTVTNTPSSNGCVYRCAVDVKRGMASTKDVAECQAFCDELDGEFEDGMCSYDGDKNCRAGEGSVLTNSGDCICDEAKGYVDISFSDELECVVHECLDDTHFFSSLTHSCSEHCSSGSDNPYCQCYGTQTKYSIEHENGIHSLCYDEGHEPDGTETKDDTKSQQHCSNDNLNSDCTCEDENNKNRMNVQSGTEMYSVYYCQGESNTGNECGTVEAGNYSSSELSASCTCSSGEKQTGYLNGEAIAYCHDSEETTTPGEKDNPSNRGDWATESTASSILGINQSILSEVSNVSGKIDGLASGLEDVGSSVSSAIGELGDELSELGDELTGGEVQGTSLDLQASGFETPVVTNFMENEEVQIAMSELEGFIQLKKVEVNELFGFEPLGSSGSELPCFDLSVPSGEEFQSCLSDIEYPLSILSKLILFLGALFALRIVLARG